MTIAPISKAIIKHVQVRNVRYFRTVLIFTGCADDITKMPLRLIFTEFAYNIRCRSFINLTELFCSRIAVQQIGIGKIADKGHYEQG